MWRCLLLLALLPTAASGDDLGDLRERLEGLGSDVEVRARIQVDVHRESQDGRKVRPDPPAAAIVAELGPQGLRLLWTADQLAAAREAERRRVDDPTLPPPQSALGGVAAWEVVQLLDAGASLLQAIEGATRVEEVVETRDGRELRRLLLRPRRMPDPEMDSAIQEYDEQLRIWIDGEGWPTEMERTMRARGRKFLVRFAIDTRVRTTFARAGGRLIVLRQREESSSEAMGSAERETRETIVSPLP